MNLIHMKYALAVARTNSINKASEELYVGAPVLSRAIKDLESDLGVTLFERSAKGMTLTPGGELFVRYAKGSLKQVEDVENAFKNGSTVKKRFSVSGPRASYIASAFAEFSKEIPEDSDIELFYRETNAYRVIRTVLHDNYDLGVLRYSELYDSYFTTMMREKSLVGELITEFVYVLVTNKNSPITKKKKVTYQDLNGLTEIAHADPYVPSLPLSEVKKDELPDHKGNRIFVFERGTPFELLSQNPNSYMWVSSIPKELLEKYGLTECICVDNKRVYKDVLIHRADYKLTDLDKAFVEKLIKATQGIFKG